MYTQGVAKTSRTPEIEAGLKVTREKAAQLEKELKGAEREKMTEKEAELKMNLLKTLKANLSKL